MLYFEQKHIEGQRLWRTSPNQKWIISRYEQDQAAQALVLLTAPERLALINLFCRGCGERLLKDGDCPCGAEHG